MSPQRPDPRKQVGALIETKGTLVTNLAELKRRYGSLWKTRMIHSNVVSWETRVNPGSSRLLTYFTADWVFGAGVVKHIAANSWSVKAVTLDDDIGSVSGVSTTIDGSTTAKGHSHLLL